MARENAHEEFFSDADTGVGYPVARNDDSHDVADEEQTELEAALRNALQYSEDENAIGLDEKRYANMHPFWPSGSDPNGHFRELSCSISSASSDQYISYCEFVLAFHHVSSYLFSTPC